MLSKVSIHIAIAALTAFALLTPARADDAKLGDIRARMQKFVDDKDLAGAVTVVGRKDAIVSYEAVGNLDAESGKAMPKDALFRIASMTKPITAVGIMILADEGKLSVDDPVEKHLPEFKGQMLAAGRSSDSLYLKKPTRPITLRDLLTHTSGPPGRMPDGLSGPDPKRQ